MTNRALLENVTIPLKAGDDPRVQFVRPRQILRITLSAPNTTVRLTLRFAQWILTTNVEDVIESVTHDLITGSSGEAVIDIHPLSGFYRLEIQLTSGSTTNLKVEDLVPSFHAIQTGWRQLDIGGLVTKQSGLPNGLTTVPASYYFDPAVVSEFEVLRTSEADAAGRFGWRTNIEDKLDPIQVYRRTSDSLRVARYEGNEYTLQYVLPTHPDASDSNTGNSLEKPRKTVNTTTSGNRTMYVLEAGYFFPYEEGWKTVGIGVDSIIVSSIPGVPAFLTAFRKLSPVMSSSDWTDFGDGSFQNTNSTIVGITEPNLVLFGPLSIGETADRPQLVPYNINSTAQIGSLKHYPTPGPFTSVRFTPFSGQSFPSLAFVHNNVPHLRLNGSGVKLFMRDIEIWGGSNVFSSGATVLPSQTVTAIRCAFRFSAAKYISRTSLGSNATLKVEGGAVVKLVECDVTDSLGDGVDGRGYLVGDPAVIQPCYIIEDRCFLGYCGYHPLDTAGKNQASTMHFGARAVRIGSQYGFTGGSCIADVMLQSGSLMVNAYSILVGCFTYKTLVSGTAATNYKFGLLYGENFGDFSAGWLVNHSFTDIYGEKGLALGEKINLRKSVSLAYDADYAVGTTLDVKKEATAVASPTIAAIVAPLRRLSDEN